MTRFTSYAFHADQGTDSSKRDCRGHVRHFLINAIPFRFTCLKMLCEIMYENRRLCRQKGFFSFLNSRWKKTEEEKNALDAMKQSLEKEGGKINRVLLVIFFLS